MGLYIFKFGASQLEKFHIKHNSPAVLVKFSLRAFLNLNFNCITPDNDKVGSRTNQRLGQGLRAVLFMHAWLECSCARCRAGLWSMSWTTVWVQCIKGEFSQGESYCPKTGFSARLRVWLHVRICPGIVCVQGTRGSYSRGSVAEHTDRRNVWCFFWIKGL